MFESMDSKQEDETHTELKQNTTPVKFRDKKNIPKSETERKRRSKNRLSNRRSTGYVTPEEIQQAKALQQDEDEGYQKFLNEINKPE